MEPVGGVCLVGFMGSGKSSVGRALARRLLWPFVDLDEVIIESTGRSISEIFATDGETAFRRSERTALEASLAVAPVVVATGGGAFCESANRQMMRSTGTLSVFLDVPWAVLLERISADTIERPLFRDVGDARRLFNERLPIYREADVTISCSGPESPEETAERIADEIAEAACAI